ncbi:hypothetical protein D1007_30386 [Hordeum vulgare]|nr:hypothetical protein D1007_30386 [Hordeum vulgare]
MDAVHTKAEACIQGLTSAMNWGMTRVVVETDSKHITVAALVMRRVLVFVAAVSQLGLTVCFFSSLMLAVSLRMGKVHCWPQGTMAAMLTGMVISSVLSMYMVYIAIAIACVFGTK